MPRPRRCGKTLMLRTLQTFFEYALDKDGKPVDNRHYFEGLKVMDDGEEVLKEMGQYPVISVSLKDVSGNSIESVLEMLKKSVYDACQDHFRLLLDHPELTSGEQGQFRRYMDKMSSEGELKSFLGDMCIWLKRITKRDVVILLDEYDVPLQKAAIYDLHHPGSELFDETVGLIGKFISAGFKSNSNLAYGIIAGCMRVAKESIFTGMNNPGVITVLDDIPDEYWGFTESDVRKLLAYYDIENWYDRIEQWYDGYFYSGRKVFNPWSLLNAIRGIVNGYGENAIKAYWGQTSSNDIIDEMIDKNPHHREILAKLMNGGTITVPVYDNLSYRDLRQHSDAIWSFLLYTGYLKAIKAGKDERNRMCAEVAVPNEEIWTIMDSSMERWWKDICLKGYNAKILMDALWDGNIEAIEDQLTLMLSKSISVFDFNESFYHGMMVGLLNTVCDGLRSNDEYGDGRPDIVMIDNRRAMILELKCVTSRELDQALKANKDTDAEYVVNACMEVKLDEAAQQIRDRKYAQGIRIEHGSKTAVTAYAMCFCRKQCMVRKVDGP